MKSLKTALKKAVVVLADRFFLLRPLVTVPAATFFLLGYAEAVLQGGDAWPGRVRALLSARDSWPGHQGPVHPWLGVVSYALLMASVYVVNQVYDAESDSANDKLFLIPRGIVSRREAWGVAAALLALGLAGGARCGQTTVLLFALSFVLGMAYSVPPLALKRLFPLDLLANAVGYGTVAFLTGWSLASTPGLNAVARSAPLALCVGGVFTLTAVHDRMGDRRSGFRTTGVTLGVERGPLLALVLLAAAVPLSLLTSNRLVLVAAAVSLPLFAYACAKRTERAVKVAYRASSSVFVLMSGLAFPGFLLAVLVLMGLARLYYSMRFALNYPTLTGR
ncbi:MAG: UbiA family prenyltransferase [Candidatus Eisenbacteria bacterium]|nr:UbiA family prenyltransferase [Candidatus Eisenbacteria bacterium]